MTANKNVTGTQIGCPFFCVAKMLQFVVSTRSMRVRFADRVIPRRPWSLCSCPSSDSDSSIFSSWRILFPIPFSRSPCRTLRGGWFAVRWCLFISEKQIFPRAEWSRIKTVWNQYSHKMFALWGYFDWNAIFGKGGQKWLEIYRKMGLYAKIFVMFIIRSWISVILYL